MKIIFITASAAPGRDGVGDYARRLAAQLISNGHRAALLALSDKYVDTPLQEKQQADEIEIDVLRIPKGWGITRQVAEAKPWINNFAPDWLSLQYVPFGFNPKGLPFGLSKWLVQLSRSAHWHIMFHELWVGMAIEESPKLIWWGRVQRALIASLVKRLKPKAVHTQTLLYQAHLSKMRISAKYLPLFGNIPVTSAPAAPKAGEVNFLLFGAIHSGGLIAPFARQASAYGKQYQVTVSLTFAGRCGDEQLQWADIWKAEGMPVTILGEQSPEELSKLLSSATAGINTTGLAVVEKSGAFAAMRDHGLPVISLSKPWSPFGVPPQSVPAGIVKYDGSNFEDCMAEALKYPPNAGKAAGVAVQLIEDLTLAI